jgi:hypothetical protein
MYGVPALKLSWETHNLRGIFALLLKLSQPLDHKSFFFHIFFSNSLFNTSRSLEAGLFHLLTPSLKQLQIK